MCGRFSVTATPADIRACFGLDADPALTPRYNVAPTQLVPVVRLGTDGHRELVALRWGLIPPFGRETRPASGLINARAETVATKPTFREAFKRQRCLVVADGFFEWRKPSARGQAKVPYLVRLRSRAPFAFAGLWARAAGPEGKTLESCTIITTDANELVARLHDRMPVILLPEAFDLWLDPEANPEGLRRLLAPLPPEQIEAFAVSSLVNTPANDGPECIVAAPPLELFDIMRS